MNLEICCTDMCRACMTNDGVLLSMYDDKTISSKNLPYKFAELTSIQIDRFDGLPNKLCAKCAYRTNTFYEFKLQVQESDKKLREMFGNQMYMIKEEELDGRNNELTLNEDNIVQTDDESFKLDSIDPNDWNSVDNINNSEELAIEAIDEIIESNQKIEIDVYQLNKNDKHRKENKLQVNSVLSNLQKASLDQIDIHTIKTAIPEEISKILEAQQLDYTIMYVPESIMEPTIETKAENLVSDPEQENIENDDIFAPVVEILSGQENVEEILCDMYTSNSVEFKVTRKSKFACKKSKEDDTSVQNEDTKTNSESNSNVKQLSKEENSDESDSDYFIDSKDNLLGSLNDTILRIKEVKEGNTIEYQCTLCLQNYDKLTGVLLHTIDNHIPSSGPFFCVVCEKDCESRRELRAHAKTHTGRFPYTCFLCNKAYTTKRYLKRHMVCHTDFPRHRCPKCGVRFKVKSELESHVTTHVHGAPYNCSQCPRLFNHKGNYKRHLISHLDPQGLHLPKYPCKVCGKRFLNNRTLETHMRVHTGEKPFCCEICGRSFSQQGNLLNHARIHSNPRSYTCDICGKRFNQRATLKDHRLLHTGEKPHVCNVCGIAFTFGAALRRHMWIHSGGKPFGCETCGARFVGKYDLRRHMQVHTDRPKVKRKKNTTSKSKDRPQEELKDESHIMEKQDTETILIEQVLLPQDVTQETELKVESEKENVDALFSLIQYD